MLPVIPLRPLMSSSSISRAPRHTTNLGTARHVRSALPPRVAEMRKWVPYFLMRFSLICCRVGRRPSNRRLRRNSGAKGSGALRKSLFSVARLLTFQWLNSLEWNHYQSSWIKCSLFIHHFSILLVSCNYCHITNKMKQLLILLNFSY